MDNFFITNCEFTTVEDLLAIGKPFEFTWYRLIGQLAYLDLESGFATLVSCTLDAREEIIESINNRLDDYDPVARKKALKYREFISKQANPECDADYEDTRITVSFNLIK